MEAESGQRAYDFCRRLVEEIGPRPAGSPAERAALEMLAAEAQRLGYQVSWQAFDFVPLATFFPYYSLAAAALLVSAALLFVFPWAVLGLPLVFHALPELNEFLRRRWPRRASSANLLAWPAGTEPAAIKLLLCAHVDSTRAMPAGGRFVQALRREVFPLLDRLSLILIAVGVASGLGLLAAPGLRAAGAALAALSAAGLAALDVYDQRGTRGRFTVGANDNASGVGVLAALMQDLAGTGSQVGFLFTGAEETGLDGASAFAHRLAGEAGHPAVISVDMVGAGSALRVITGTRSLTRLHTDASLNRLLLRADPLAQPHLAVRRSGDFAPFLHAGIPASAIESNGTPQSWRAYHTGEDDLDLLDPLMLRHTLDVLNQAVRIFERSQAQED
ncbi:MAG: M28 family peptidase [Anaerolineaceae bacterium]|nr:M28 family peptidase [Anaerolineaceae bacterium]